MQKTVKKRQNEKPELRLQLAQQLAIFLENRPGVLARICETLGEENINIFAVSTSDTVDHTVIRMVLSDTAAAVRIFEEHGTLVVTSDVLMIDGTNKPGSLAAIARRLGEAKINIDYAYSATHPNVQKGLLILRVSDARKAMKVLNT
jgi:hypothetical protein